MMSIRLILPSNYIADVASWLKIPCLRKADPLCEENIHFMRDALADCVLNCKHFKGTDFLPTRLLDLGPQKNLESIRLINSPQIVPSDVSDVPRYAALSYCWGPSFATDGVQQVCTKVGNIESMRRHVPKQAIPQVILDAIEVCKALSIRYLWVDSLCIIQDELSDWERESASMTLIYKNAFVTICTPSSRSSNEGFLVRHRRHVAIPFHSRTLPSINGHYNLVASGTFLNNGLPGWPELDINSTYWNSRGWTFQEYEMSNRLLLFGKSMVHFQCRHLVSENGYRQTRKTVNVRRMIETLEDAHSTSKSSYLHWETILDLYGMKDFTIVEDRLPGISGMAKYIADKNDDEYFAGIWKTGLPSKLVWHVYCTNVPKYYVELPDLLNMLRNPTPYIAPSWSPLGRDGGVYQGIRGGTRLYQGSAASTVVDASVTCVGENPFGRVQSGWIRIRGRFTTVLSDIYRLTCDENPPFVWYTLDKGVITYYNLDWVPDGDSCNRGELCMLLISSMEVGDPTHLWCHQHSPEAARHCFENLLSLHAAGPGSSPASSLAESESQADQSSDRTQSETGSSLSRRLGAAQSSKAVDTGARTQPSPDGEDRLHESKSDPSGFRAGSEDRPENAQAHNRDAYGLLVHHLPGTNTYVRVGVWASMVEDGGGTARFQNMDEREIDIV